MTIFHPHLNPPPSRGRREKNNPFPSREEEMRR